MPELGFFSNPTLFGALTVSCLLQLSVVTLPFASPIFEAAAHPVQEWLLVLLLALTPVTIIEVTKLVRASCLRPPNDIQGASQPDGSLGPA
jgi:magnesium-transporting ATPase (P-type)